MSLGLRPVRPPHAAWVLDSAWRAALYCLMPRVVGLSLLPLLALMASLGGLAWWGWEAAVAGVRGALEQSALLDAALQWLSQVGADSLRAVLAPLIVVALTLPVVVVLCLLGVSQFMMPALVALVQRRRFAALEARHVTPWWQGAARGLGLSLLAVVVLALSLPLWLLPPVAWVLPPLVWGWLTMQLMGFDVLALHATPPERAELMRRHRGPLWLLGLLTALLGAAPSLLWAFSALTLVLAPLVLLVSIWMYTAVFVFSALWFTHFLLNALHHLRREALEAAL